jgi:ABC-2 type transport system permease protein
VIRRVWANARVQGDELLHLPAFAAPTVGFPLAAYLLFGLPVVHGNARVAAGVFVSFAAFALLGIVMFDFGVGIAANRSSPWERFVRTLPASGSERFAARLLVALGFGVAALVPLAICALVATPLRLDGLAWARIASALLAGAVPLGLLGIMLGYLLSDRAALPVTNLIYLPLSYIGGLFSADSGTLPEALRQVSPWLPTRQWRDLLDGFGINGQLPVHALLGLTCYGAIFAALAIYGYRREEQQQYS